jgi:hypothetical protein
MALTKSITYDYELRTEFRFIQVREKTAIIEDGKELSYSYKRYVLEPKTIEQGSVIDTDVSGESTEIQALTNAVWTDEIKSAHASFLESRL